MTQSISESFEKLLILSSLASVKSTGRMLLPYQIKLSQQCIGIEYADACGWRQKSGRSAPAVHDMIGGSGAASDELLW